MSGQGRFVGIAENYMQALSPLSTNGSYDLQNCKGEEAPMLAATIIAILAVAVSFARAATRLTAYAATLEWCGGVLLISGLGLLGAALPKACCGL